MNKYTIHGKITPNKTATFESKEQHIEFGITKEQNELQNPAELLLGAFAACCLKNIERFSPILKFDYDHAEIEVIGERQEVPTKIIGIQYHIKIKSANLNAELLHKNIQKFGTIYNTLKVCCTIRGQITLDSN